MPNAPECPRQLPVSLAASTLNYDVCCPLTLAAIFQKAVSAFHTISQGYLVEVVRLLQPALVNRGGNDCEIRLPD